MHKFSKKYRKIIQMSICEPTLFKVQACFESVLIKKILSHKSKSYGVTLFWDIWTGNCFDTLGKERTFFSKVVQYYQCIATVQPEVSHHFYIYNKSDLFGTLTKVPLPDVFWCDTFFIKMQKTFYYFVIITCKSILLCYS